MKHTITGLTASERAEAKRMQEQRLANFKKQYKASSDKFTADIIYITEQIRDCKLIIKQLSR